jgi:hypothetical protein
MPGEKRDKLVKELQRLNFYWQELSAGKSETELERLIWELKQERSALKNIFNYRIMGEIEE